MNTWKTLLEACDYMSEASSSSGQRYIFVTKNGPWGPFNSEKEAWDWAKDVHFKDDPSGWERAKDNGHVQPLGWPDDKLQTEAPVDVPGLDVGAGVKTQFSQAGALPIKLTIGKKQHTFTPEEFVEMIESGQIQQMVNGGQVRKLPGIAHTKQSAWRDRTA
jgi:hypothetical protein